MAREQAVGRPAEQREALAKLDNSLSRVDRALRDLEKEKELEEELLRRWREVNRDALRLRRALPRPPGPWDFLGDLVFNLAFPGEVNTSGQGPCFLASCAAGSFVRGVQRNNCTPPPPFCFAQLPITAMPPGHQNRQAAIASDGITLTHWMEWWTTTNPLNYVVGKIYGPLAAPENIGYDPALKVIPFSWSIPQGLAGAVVANPNMIRPQQPDPSAKPRDGTKTKEFDDEALPRGGRYIVWGFTVGGPATQLQPKPAVRPQPKLGVAMLPPPPSPVKKRMREAKVSPRMNGLFRGAAWLFDLYTESNDFVTAIWKALPSEIRCGELRYGPRGNPYRVRVSPHRRKGDVVAKASDIYKHFDKIDYGQALLNLIANHLEDATIGRSQQRLLELAGGYESNSNHAGVTMLRQALRDSKKAMDQVKATMPSQHKGCS